MLADLFRRAPIEERAQASFWGDWGGTSMKTWSGTNVDAETSLQLLTVYGCVRLITDSIATLPIDTYRMTGDTKVEISTPAWLANPTADLDFTAWCTQVLSSLLLDGNAYIVVLRYADGRGIDSLVPLDPAIVSVRREGGRKVYYLNGSRFDGEMLHIKGLMLAGTDVGLSPVEYARQSIGLGLTATKYGAEFFDNEGNMPGVIELPRPAQPDTLRAMAESWRRKRAAGNRGLPGVLPDGATWRSTGVTNEQAQFLATRRYQAAEIAAQMFMVDPSELGIGVEGTSLTYANLEQRATRFVRVSLQPWMVRIEKAVSDLMSNPRYMRFNVNALLRGDLPTRYQAYAVGIAAGFIVPNEARAWEDLPELDDVIPMVDIPGDNFSTQEVPT
jgi:HK97 family phage portal protein